MEFGDLRFISIVITVDQPDGVLVDTELPPDIVLRNDDAHKCEYHRFG